MRKPIVAKPRMATTAFSLSRTLPKLTLPRSAAVVPARPRPNVGRPGKITSLAQPSIPSQPPPQSVPPAPGSHPGPAGVPRQEGACVRCGHREDDHPVRYVCDKYPHPDPLQICGCESEHLDEVCAVCGHKGRWHKPRHRCRRDGCYCWAFDEGDA
jgi:hypothetical protein